MKAEERELFRWHTITIESQEEADIMMAMLSFSPTYIANTMGVKINHDAFYDMYDKYKTLYQKTKGT